VERSATRHRFNGAALKGYPSRVASPPPEEVHDQHDRTTELVVEATVEGVVEPFVRRWALGLRHGLLGLQRVVDNDQVRTPPNVYRHTAPEFARVTHANLGQNRPAGSAQPQVMSSTPSVNVSPLTSMSSSVMSKRRRVEPARA
jgi:hypothetical protein